MNDHLVLRAVNEVLSNKGMPPCENFAPSLHFFEDLGFSSLDLAELTVRIEDLSGIDVFADGLIKTLGGVSEKLNRATAA